MKNRVNEHAKGQNQEKQIFRFMLKRYFCSFQFDAEALKPKTNYFSDLVVGQCTRNA